MKQIYAKIIILYYNLYYIYYILAANYFFNISYYTFVRCSKENTSHRYIFWMILYDGARWRRKETRESIWSVLLKLTQRTRLITLTIDGFINRSTAQHSRLLCRNSHNNKYLSGNNDRFYVYILLRVFRRRVSESGPLFIPQLEHDERPPLRS